MPPLFVGISFCSHFKNDKTKCSQEIIFLEIIFLSRRPATIHRGGY